MTTDPNVRRMTRPRLPSCWEATLSPALIRTVRALALTRGPISARSLAGSYRTGPTIAALSWLVAKGFVQSGTSHMTGRHKRPEPVYWLTTEGTQLHRQLCAATEARGPRSMHRKDGPRS